jgi:TolA-binding protein
MRLGRACPPVRALSRELSLAGSGAGDRRVREHVGGCPSCLAEWNALERLRELTRALPPPGVSPEELEGVRTALLVDSRPPGSRRGRRVLWALLPAIAAILALASLHPRARKGGASPDGRRGAAAPAATLDPRRGTVRPSPGAVFSVLAGQPDEVVRLRDGALGVEVEPLSEHERFRVVTGDAEVEVWGTSFVVAAQADRLRSVSVARGRVVVRPRSRDPMVLGAGQRWAAADPEPPPEAPGPADGQGSARPPARKKGALALAAPSRAGTSPAGSAPSAVEIAFADGWQALRAQRFAEGAAAFARASAAAGRAPLAEDAWFWMAVCQARVPRPAQARSSLSAFIERFPRSPRVGEASGMLGWILLDEGELEGAARRFSVAARDPGDEVRRSARAGLEQVAARRGAAPHPALIR